VRYVQGAVEEKEDEEEGSKRKAPGGRA